jgi:hypothetical protein
LVAAGGFASSGGRDAAGGFVTGGGAVMAGGFVTSGTESKVSGQLEIGSDAARFDVSWLIVEDGGQAGIVCSVGGSGGHTSVSSGIAPWAGATSSSGGSVGGVCGPPAGGHVRLDAVAGSSVSARGSPGGAGTVCAHFGAGFCIGTACFGSVACAGSAGFSVLAQSGSDSFCIGSAGSGSASGAVSAASCVPLSLIGGTTGTVLAQTGVVSCVGTAAAGSSGGTES